MSQLDVFKLVFVCADRDEANLHVTLASDFVLHLLKLLSSKTQRKM